MQSINGEFEKKDTQMVVYLYRILLSVELDPCWVSLEAEFEGEHG